jgi:hypothetical protein
MTDRQESLREDSEGISIGFRAYNHGTHSYYLT